MHVRLVSNAAYREVFRKLIEMRQFILMETYKVMQRSVPREVREIRCHHMKRVHVTKVRDRKKMMDAGINIFVDTKPGAKDHANALEFPDKFRELRSIVQFYSAYNHSCSGRAGGGEAPSLSKFL
jgi:hypothetical protein